MKFIRLHNTGLVTRVSDEDYEMLAAHKWLLGSRQYAQRHRVKSDPPGPRIVFMHRVILGALPGRLVDHIDGDSLNNQRSNLRLATPAMNSQNHPSKPGSTSKYKGVCWVTQLRKWRAQYKSAGQITVLGHYADEIEAALAYDAAVRNIHGDNAYQNFPLKHRVASEAA